MSYFDLIYITDIWFVIITVTIVCKYSDTSANEDTSFRNHIR